MTSHDITEDIYSNFLPHSCFAHLSKSIAVRAGFQERDAFTEFHYHFPDFMWLIRDFTLALPENSEGQQLTPTEYIMQRVLGTTEDTFPPSPTVHVAKSILTFFPSIECRTIPPPSDDPAVLQRIEENEHQLSPRFKDTVEKVIELLKANIKVKTGLTSDQIVTGPLLAHAMEEFVQALNDPGAVPNLENTWQVVILSKLENTVAELVNDYEEKMNELAVDRMPLGHDGSGQGGLPTLMGIHRSLLESEVKKLEHKLCSLVPVGTTLGEKSAGDIRTELTEKLVCNIVQYRAEVLKDGTVKRVVQGGKLLKFVEKNYRKSDSHCRQVFNERYSQLKRKLATFDKDYTFQQLKKDLKSLQEEFFMHAIGPAKWDVYDYARETIEFEMEQFRRVKDFQEQAYEAAQRAENARVESVRMKQVLEEVQAQADQDRKLNNERLKRMKRENEEALRRLYREREQERQEENKRFGQVLESKLRAVKNTMKRQVRDAEEKFQRRIRQMERDKEREESSGCILM